jgi:hypothetical protein
MNELTVFQPRGPLRHTRQALQEGSITIGFIGGSITDPRPECNWPEPVSAWFVETFPGVRVNVENAAIGATGSDLAVFRARRDLIDRGCDLVFVEFAVNDSGSPTEQRMRSREGLLRKLLAGTGRDVVLTYTYMQTFYTDMMQGQVPASIAEFEQLAEHYSLGSVWMGLHSLLEVQKGRMRWEEWLPDGLHPQQRGSLSYAQSVIAYLERELLPGIPEEKAPSGEILPPPLNPLNWEEACSLPFSNVHLAGPWMVRNWPKLAWIDQVLHTAAVGATLSFDFQGRGLVLGFDFGKTSSEFRYRLDGGPWQLSERERPEWMGADGWYRTFIVGDDLPRGRHTFELEVVHGNVSGDYAQGVLYSGTNCNLALIGIIP